MQQAGLPRFELVPPEPARFWIRHAPRTWPGPDGWWIDIASAEPARAELRSEVARAGDKVEFHDVVYLPPVKEGAGLIVEQVLKRCADLGVPALQQILPGQVVVDGPGVVVVDLTGTLIHGRLMDTEILPDTWVLWPLLPGLSDGEKLRDAGLAWLAGSGAAGVLPVAPSLTPPVRRQLAELGSASAYGKLFHQEYQPRVAEFARAAAAAGLPVYPSRPKLADARRAPNRSLASHFAMLGELWLGSGRPEGRAQAFFSLARRLYEEPLDVGELARRGGLAGVSWIDREARSEIHDLSTEGTSRLMLELEALFYEREGRSE